MWIYLNIFNFLTTGLFCVSHGKAYNLVVMVTDLGRVSKHNNQPFIFHKSLKQVSDFYMFNSSVTDHSESSKNVWRLNVRLQNK